VGFYSGNVLELLDDVVVSVLCMLCCVLCAVLHAVLLAMLCCMLRCAALRCMLDFTSCFSLSMRSFFFFTAKHNPPNPNHQPTKLIPPPPPIKQTLKPNVFVSVPRLWNRIYDRCGVTRVISSACGCLAVHVVD